MAPTQQESREYTMEEPSAAESGVKIVISGMSGLFPQSRSVKDLSDILYEKKYPISEKFCRWKTCQPEAPNLVGNIFDLDLFDANFFKVHSQTATCMDPMCKKLLEMAYQAIYDAGVCPVEFWGKKLGVYIGACFTETEKVTAYEFRIATGHGITGCSKAMFANRISYYLNAKGPSISVDDSCCSSHVALQQAIFDIQRGTCEAAIVGGSNLCIHPQVSVHYSRVVTLSKDGLTKSFDENANGCARSEAISVIFLQKAEVAKRIYAEVVHLDHEFTGLTTGETGPRFGFYRDPMRMAKFLKKFYEKAKVNPQDVEYVEAMGAAVPEIDRSELEALEEVFCKNRRDPLLVGSIMSNIGYTEAACGVSAITKVLLGYERGEIAANLHCVNPLRDIAAIRDGKMEIVTDHKKFGRLYTAVNGISITGVNAHILLKGHFKPKDLARYKSEIPHLVAVTARQDYSAGNILEDLKSRPIDPEEIALLHHVHKTKVPGHMGRGYSILSTDDEGQTITLGDKVTYFDQAQRPLCFVYSGMGSQWVGMGTQLMRISVFAAAIERCHKVLEPKGLNIVDIITSLDKTIFDNILHSFVGIAAIQIGLTDILTASGLVPDTIIGHSVGELGCAYADGCLTAEEMILTAYYRGLVSIQTTFIRGTMAAVGLGYQQIKNLLPPQIQVACHNSNESSTISGPIEIMKQFVAELTSQGIFAKEVPCSNIPYHSRYIAEAGPGLLKYLKEVIKNPKARTERWLSTSVPYENWNEPLAKYCSAEYHTNNLLSSVLFEETSQLLPKNAVLVEIAPHGLLQAILKRSLPESCLNIALTRRGHPDNAFLVLEAIGKLYIEGFWLDLAPLYPKVDFPVSTGTPMLSHLVEWAHEEKWNLPVYAAAATTVAASIKFVISVHDDEHSCLRGHVIKGKNLYPFSAALVAVWDTLAMVKGAKRRNVAVRFEDVHLYAQPQLYDQKELRISVAVQRATGRFEITTDNRIVAQGYIRTTHDKWNQMDTSSRNDKFELNSDDVYDILREKDYDYKDEFRSIHKSNASFTEAQILWNDNWVTFLDGVLQLHSLRNSHDALCLPSLITSLTIKLKRHNNSIVTENGKTFISAIMSDDSDVTKCGGITIENIKFRNISLRDEEAAALKILKFVPWFSTNSDAESAVQVFLQVVSENINKDSINVMEVVTNPTESGAMDEIKSLLTDIIVNYKRVHIDQLSEKNDYLVNNTDLVFVQNLSLNDRLCQSLHCVLPCDSFMINIEQRSNDRIRPSSLYRVVSTHNINDTKIELVKWKPLQLSSASTVVARSKSDLSFLASTRKNILQQQKLVVISSYPPIPGLKDLIKQWRREPYCNQIYLVMLSENDNLEQLPELHLAYSVLNNGVWGGEYYTSWQKQVNVERGIALRCAMPGDLNALEWVEKANSVETGIPVTVHYTAINNLDVKKATGVTTGFTEGDYRESSYCMDFSGVTDSGERVMGILQSGAASDRIMARPELLWPVPSHWSLEDAVTVPSAYLQALYCYEKTVQLHPELKILVHGGAGALGQAAITIALANNCEVFATVSDLKKKKFLMSLFPTLKEDHIGNSRDHTFADLVLNATNGLGCHIVFCSVRGLLKNDSLKVTIGYGHVLDTDQMYSREEFCYGMSNLTNNRAYIQIDFHSLLASNELENLEFLNGMLTEGIANGYVRPLSRVIYSPHEVSRAFRLLAGSRHRGRVVLRLQDSVPVVQPRLFCSSGSCHVIICENKIFGMQLANTLVARGARKLHLLIRNVSAHLSFKKRVWENLGVEVLVSTEDARNNIIKLLEKSTALGPVEAVYIVSGVVTEQTVENITGIVSSLDSATRKLCPSLRYFAIANAGELIGQQICNARVRDGLPATTVSLPALREGESHECIQGWHSYRGAVNALERAIRSSHSALLAVPQRKAAPSLLQQILKIAEIKLSEETPDHITLRDLNIELTKISFIQVFLRDSHNVCLNETDLLNLTPKKIRDLEESMADNQFKEVRGFKNFFSQIDPDELVATVSTTIMPTQISSGFVRYDVFDVSQAHLWIIPGIEGHHARFNVLCERLKLPAIVLQPGLDRLDETFRETAERYSKELLDRLDVKNHFYLLGYESGVIIALKVAAILEKLGMTGTVFCVGGTPDDIQTTLLDQLKEYETEDSLQDAVVKYMFSLMTGSAEGLDQELKNVFSWKDKIEVCVKSLLRRVPHSGQYASTLIEYVYQNIVQFRSYKPQPQQLRSKIILLRASFLSTGSSLAASQAATASMQRYSKQPVVLYQLEAPLAEATYDLRCGAIINRHLSNDILEKFNNSNHCEVDIKHF